MAASSMYKMKPVYGTSEVVEEYPTCMYKMKNIHGNSAEELDIDDPVLLEIINRQEAVLKELEKLKDEVHQIGVDIGINNQNQPAKVPSAKHPAAVAKPESCNLVVKASPDDPPLAVNLLCQLVRQHGIDCSLKSHVHSSWRGQVPNELCELFSTPCNENSRVCLRFIWESDLLAPNLMVSVATQSPILGEANILRYLARLFLPQLYSDGNPLQVTTIDDWLNSAANFASTKDGEIFIQNLDVHLGKHNWLSGNAPSIADIYCCVTLLKHGNQFPKNISRWIAQCKKELSFFDQLKTFASNMKTVTGY